MLYQEQILSRGQAESMVYLAMTLKAFHTGEGKEGQSLASCGGRTSGTMDAGWVSTRRFAHLPELVRFAPAVRVGGTADGPDMVKGLLANERAGLKSEGANTKKDIKAGKNERKK
jgi:hypothetical protein